MFRDFAGGPGAKTLPPHAAGQASIPGQGTTMPHSTVKKKKLSSYYVSSTILAAFRIYI